MQILLDNGIGLGGQNVQHLKNGVKGLLEALPENLEVTLVTTAPQPRFLAAPTTDRAAVQKGLDLLAPDGGAGRFVESLNEATQRIEKDKTDYFPVIISVAHHVGGSRREGQRHRADDEAARSAPDHRARHPLQQRRRRRAAAPTRPTSA